MKKIMLFIFLILVLLCSACSSEKSNEIHNNPINPDVNNSKTENLVDDETNETENHLRLYGMWQRNGKMERKMSCLRRLEHT